jgi:hypothetical protein
VLDAEEHPAQVDGEAAVEVLNRRLRHRCVDAERSIVDVDM